MEKKRRNSRNIHVTRVYREKRRPDAPIYVLGIDPGLSGHFVIFDGDCVANFKMPVRKLGKITEIIFDDVHELLSDFQENYGQLHVFLERAVSFGMGSTGAFNYGRGFAAIEIALELVKLPVTYIEPHVWAKEMHQGISKDLKPKAKSLVAAERLFPQLVDHLPKNRNGKIDDGAIDALLIAAYGSRKLKGGIQKETVPDFY